jgi:hypothetical protein
VRFQAHRLGEGLPLTFFDGDDEPGDPSGLHLVILGWAIGIYWPMRRGVGVSWSTGSPLRVTRWEPR